jgi:nicotinic acid mononucleotide adenylyltransferase
MSTRRVSKKARLADNVIEKKEEGKGDTILKTKQNVCFVYGRFNPPTRGHVHLLEVIKTLAAAKDADAYAFLTSSIAQPKSPLDVYTKVAFLKKMVPVDFPVKIINTTDCECKTAPQVIAKLREAGYDMKNMTMIVGADRVADFSFIREKGANVITDPALARAEEGEGAAASANPEFAMSATKMREAAVAGNTAVFAAGTKLGRMTDADVKELMNEVRVGLGQAPMTGGRRKRRTLKLKGRLRNHRA